MHSLFNERGNSITSQKSNLHVVSESIEFGCLSKLPVTVGLDWQMEPYKMREIKFCGFSFLTATVKKLSFIKFLDKEFSR